MNKGFIPVMLTPYTATGKVDYDGLTQLTEYYLQAGAKGLSSIAGNFYPEVMVWLCDHATDPAQHEKCGLAAAGADSGGSINT